MRRSFPYASLLLLAASAPLAHAQAASSRDSSTIIAAGNYIPGTNDSLAGLAGDSSDVGALVSSSVSGASWTGKDGNGDERTMTFDATATAQANLGRLRTSAYGKITNTYYNAENDPYYDGSQNQPDPVGSPSSFAVASFVGFTDRLSYGGGAAAGYKAQYRFFVDGIASGTSIYAYLSAKIGNNAAEEFSVDLSPATLGPSGRVGRYFSTSLYTISNALDQTIDVDFTAQFLPSTFVYDDGSTVESSLNFSSTVTLDAILLYDANSRPVGNYTVTGSTGQVYPVPEPAAFAPLGLGLLALLRRKRKA